MKRSQKAIANVALALTMLAVGTACDMGKSTTIVNKTNNLYQKIKYSGQVVFSGDEKRIEHISNDGYLEFERNGRSFKAENEQGKIAYSFNGDDKVIALNEEQQQFMAEAVHEIIKARANARK